MLSRCGAVLVYVEGFFDAVFTAAVLRAVCGFDLEIAGRGFASAKETRRVVEWLHLCRVMQVGDVDRVCFAGLGYAEVAQDRRRGLLRAVAAQSRSLGDACIVYIADSDEEEPEAVGRKLLAQLGCGDEALVEEASRYVWAAKCRGLGLLVWRCSAECWLAAPRLADDPLEGDCRGYVRRACHREARSLLGDAVGGFGEALRSAVEAVAEGLSGVGGARLRGLGSVICDGGRLGA